MGTLEFKPGRRKCLYCKQYFYIMKPAKKVECPHCGKKLGVVQAKSLKLSKIVSE